MCAVAEYLEVRGERMAVPAAEAGQQTSLSESADAYVATIVASGQFTIRAADRHLGCDAKLYRRVLQRFREAHPKVFLCHHKTASFFEFHREPAVGPYRISAAQIRTDRSRGKRLRTNGKKGAANLNRVGDVLRNWRRQIAQAWNLTIEAQNKAQIPPCCANPAA